MSKLLALHILYSVQCSVVDPERFDADPDPSSQADMDPAPELDKKILARERKQIPSKS